jgi:hypothetical protein
MCDVDNAAVVEVDVDRRNGGVIVHWDELMRAVVDALHEDVCVVEDRFVVGRQERWALREDGGHKQGNSKLAKNSHGFKITPYWMTCTAPRPTSDSTCSMKATSAATRMP